MTEAPATPTHQLVRRREEVPKFVAALAVLGGTTAVALRGVPGWEEQVFEAVNGLPDALEPVLWAPMQLGSLFGPALVAGGTWLAWRRRPGWWRPTAGSVVVGLVAWQLAKVVKDTVERGRPGDVLEEIVRRAGTPADGFGFVSGHSAVAFGLATVLSPYLGRRGRWAAYGLAALVGFARVHVGAHLPLDTVGGAALGVTLALVWHLAVGIPDNAPVFHGRYAGPAT